MGFDVVHRNLENLEKIVMEQEEVTLRKHFSLDAFAELATAYPDLRMERESDGTVTIMSPVKRKTGRREITLSGILYMWHERYQNGEIHGPNTGIQLPTTAIKSPAACWVSDERLVALPPENEDDGWLRAVPDFVVEVRSKSDSLAKLKKKMTDSWQVNGVRLGWLIDPAKEQAWIYRLGETEPELVEGFTGKKLSGEDVLPGVVLPLEKMRSKKS